MTPPKAVVAKRLRAQRAAHAQAKKEEAARIGDPLALSSKSGPHVPKPGEITGPFAPGEYLRYSDAFFAASPIEQSILEEHDKQIGEEIEDYRRAAEVHRRVRAWAQAEAKPGIKLLDFVRGIETRCATYLGAEGLESGMAFPCGVSINNCAAHYTPLLDDDRVLHENDIMKVDFGTHVRGCIIDSAFTVHFNPMFDDLSLASKEATNAAIKASGPDACIGDIGDIIEEVICSHEVEIDGQRVPVVPVRNLSGHQIARWIIHAGNSIPNAAHSGNTARMLEGEIYAIETFASTGRGEIAESGECSHWMLNQRGAAKSMIGIKSPAERSVLSYLQGHHRTMAFCQNWLEYAEVPDWEVGFRLLCQQGFIDDYPPLCDIKGSYVAQWEHTIVLKGTGVEVLSRGEDY